jgi:DNA polymerase-3 subunit alpha
MYATLRNEGDKDSRTEYLIEAKRLGIRILLPHVNESDLDFSIQGNAIRFGLSNIKFISTNLGSRLMAVRPFKNYKELYDIVMEQGSGLSTRVLQAVNAVGAAAFEDNPRTGNEKDNYYEYLGIPAFDVAAITPEMKAQFRNLEDFEERGCFIVMGMVKKIKRGKGWSRIEIVDETGTAGIFHNENTLIEAGQMYVILVGDNRVSRYIPVSELKERENDAFVRFLNKSELNIDQGKYVVIAFQSRATKAGKKMAHLVLADKDKQMKRVLAFPGMFHKAYGFCQEGRVVSCKFGSTDDDTLFLREVSA